MKAQLALANKIWPKFCSKKLGADLRIKLNQVQLSDKSIDYPTGCYRKKILTYQAKHSVLLVVLWREFESYNKVPLETHDATY